MKFVLIVSIIILLAKTNEPTPKCTECWGAYKECLNSIVQSSEKSEKAHLALTKDPQICKDNFNKCISDNKCTTEDKHASPKTK